jgi:hypothetical protein
MPGVGFEHTIPVFGRTKTVHALDRATTVTGKKERSLGINPREQEARKVWSECRRNTCFNMREQHELGLM